MKMQPIMGEFRLGEDFGEIMLSVVGGSCFYSSPRETLSELDDYTAIELGFLLNGELSRPSDYDDSLKPWDHHFEDGSMPVAGYMPVADYKALRDKVASIMAAADAYSDAIADNADVIAEQAERATMHFDTGAAGRDVCPKHGTELDPFGLCLRCDTE